MDQTISTAPTRSCPDIDGSFAYHGPFALHPEQLRAQIENEIAPFVTQREVDAETSLHGLPDDCLLGNHALLIRREHTPTVAVLPDEPLSN
jgi:hypothetical protein